VRDLFQAIDEERWGDVESCFHEEVVVHVEGGDDRRGRGEIGRLFRGIPEQYVTHRDRVEMVLADEHRALALVQFTGTTTDDTHVSFWAAIAYWFDGDLIREERVVLNPHALAANP
jgi:hypothetical protein